MKIFYDPKSDEWYHSELDSPLTMGGNHLLINCHEALRDNVNFELRMKNNHIGPLIGIITSRNLNGTIVGNGPLFIRLQKKLISLAGISFIFTLEDVFHDYINGYTFLPEKNIWVKVKTPYPDLVYNRLPFRRSEQTVLFQKLKLTLQEKNIPFFNPCFIDKYELYCLLTKHAQLKNNVPETILIKEKEELWQFLLKHKAVYLKPTLSAKGKGIMRVKLCDDGHIKLDSITKRDVFPSFQHLWENIESNLRKKKYLAQKEIKSALYEGKRFDFRILAHAEHNRYHVTGIGIRQSQNQEITTHIPAGGRLVPYQLVQTNLHDQFIKKAVNQIGKTLSEHFGYFGEFSIDAGLSESNQYYLYEVNSKPMSFDEEEIEENRINQLALLFFQLTGFSFD